jgi:hypothetical protein
MRMILIAIDALIVICAGAVLHQAPSSWGSVLFQGDAFIPPAGQPTLVGIAGLAADGSEVVALLDGPWLGDSVVGAQASLCFDKPPNMSFDQAAQFPLLALRAAAALDRLGLDVPACVGSAGPPRRSTSSSGATADETVLVAGSAGRMPSLLVQLLRQCGVRAVVASRAKDADALTELGAERVIDHDCDSWAQLLSNECVTLLRTRPAAGVLDCVGEEEIPELVQEQLGATYVSLASPALKALIECAAAKMIRARSTLPHPQSLAGAHARASVRPRKLRSLAPHNLSSPHPAQLRRLRCGRQPVPSMAEPTAAVCLGARCQGRTRCGCAAGPRRRGCDRTTRRRRGRGRARARVFGSARLVPRHGVGLALGFPG